MDLNKEIKLFDNKKKTKLPVKTSMNLYQPDTKNDPKRFVAIGIIAFLVLVLVFSNFVIFPKLNEISTLKGEISNLEAQSQIIKARIQNYDQVREDYYRYSESYSKDEEQLLDRIAILTLLSESSKDVATITSTTITGNLVNLSIITENLDQVRELKKILENNTLVTSVNVYSASRSTGDVVTSISFKCIANKEGE